MHVITVGQLLAHVLLYLIENMAKTDVLLMKRVVSAAENLIVEDGEDDTTKTIVEVSHVDIALGKRLQNAVLFLRELRLFDVVGPCSLDKLQNLISQ